MKRFEVVTHEEPGFAGPFRARLVVSAGVPTAQDGMTPLSPGVARGLPVVVIGQDAGDNRTRTGNQLQAIRPEDARRLAWALMEAADEAERPNVAEDLQAKKE